MSSATPGAARRRLGALVLVCVPALVASCAGEASAEGGERALFGFEPARELELEMVDIAFGLDEMEIAAEAVVSIRVENSGNLVHDITLESPGTRFAYRVLDGAALRQDAPRRSTAHLALRPGSTAELRLEVTEPGEYEYYCAVPGHRGSGMRGTLVVG